jgi:hypothetical protein
MVFTRAEARACGWSDEAITRAIRSGRIHRVRHGVLTVADVPGLAAAAAAGVCPSGVVSHRSAAALWAIPVLGRRTTMPELTVPPDGIGSLAGVHLYRATLRPCDITMIGATPTTSAARTAVDLARHMRFAAGVAALDDVLHRGLATADDIDDVVRACWNWPGIRRAHRVIRAADRRAESPLESVSRLVIARLRLPRPNLNPTIRGTNGRFLGRCDFYWDEFGVAGEADGRGKYDAREVLCDEKERQEGLECAGLVVTRWGWIDATTQPRLFRMRLQDAFERGHLRDRSGFPRKWSVHPA